MKQISSSLLAFLGFILISLLFFYPIIKGQIPFPGESLVSNYAPYTSYSYGGYAPGGVPNKAQGPDVIKEIYPWKLFVIDQLKKGQIPFWNPYNFSGNPLMANFQSNVFYPFNSIFFLFSFTTSWTLYIFLAPVLSGYFLYLYLKHKQLEKLPAFFGGVVFAFSSYMTVWVEYGNIGHTLLWLPLALFLTDLFIESKKLRYAILLVVVLLFSFLAGYIQGFFYLTGIIFLYTFIHYKRIEKKYLLFLLPLLGVSLILGAFQLLPTLALFSNSSRGGYTLSQIQYLLNPVWYVITILVPDFFGNPATRNYWFNGTYIERVASIGFIPLWFALSAIFQKQKSKEIVFFSVLALFSLLFTTDIFITKYFYLIPIPVISTTVPTRMLSVFVVCMSILAAFGLDSFIKRKEKYPIIISGLLIGTILVFSGAVAFFAKHVFQTIPAEAFSVSVKNLFLVFVYFVIGSILFGLGIVLRSKKNSLFFISIAFFLITIFDLFRFFQKITPFSKAEFVYPQTPLVSYLQANQGIDRSWGYDQGAIESNFQTVDKVYSPEGNDPLHNRQYTEFIMSSKDGKIPLIPARPDANIFNSNTDVDFLHNPYRQKVLNILGVKYVLNKDTSLGKDLRTNNQRFDPASYSLIWQEGPWQIYENKQVAPRIFFTSRYTVQSDPQSTLNTLFSPHFDVTKEIVLEKNGIYPSASRSTLRDESSGSDSKSSGQDPSASSGQGPFASGSGTIKLISYTPNRITFSVSANTNGYAFISDVYTPNWKAKVDGNITPILRADYAFRAIPVQKGTHLVTMSYQDSAFIKGMWLSLMGTILLVGYFAFFRYYKKWNI